jgi:hypothetical protein
MYDLTCAAEIYALTRDYVPDSAKARVAELAVEIFVNEGYSFDQIDEELGGFDEIYDAIQNQDEEENEESESESEDDYYIQDEE